MIDVQYIRGFTAGNALQIHRKISNPEKPEPVISATLYVVSSTSGVLLEKTVQAHLSRIDPPPDDGLILNPGNAEPFVVDFKINIFADETVHLLGTPDYIIKLSTISNVYEVETGKFLTDDPVQLAMEAHPLVALLADPAPLPPPPVALPLPVPGDPRYISDTSYVTYSDACVTVGGRMALIIDGFLDSILGDYRQLRVHDEHGRRIATNPLKLRLTYEYLNKYTTPEIFDGNNEPISFDLVDFDFRNGIFSVAGDDGRQDYFCSYTFNFFPEKILRMFCEQTVLEMNFVGAGAGGGFITHYTALEETPKTWDGLIALGAAAKAWKRLATQTVLWRNWLIFEGDVGEGVTAPGGAAAQQAANDAAQFYQVMYDTYAAATKFEKYVALPTDTWLIFANTGFGSWGPMGPGNQVVTNSKFRGLTINKSYTF